MTFTAKKDAVAISLKGKSKKELALFVREIFSHFNGPDKSKYLDHLKRSQKNQGFIYFVNFVLNAILRFGNDTSVEALKNIVDSFFTNGKN